MWCNRLRSNGVLLTDIINALTTKYEEMTHLSEDSDMSEENIKFGMGVHLFLCCIYNEYRGGQDEIVSLSMKLSLYLCYLRQLSQEGGEVHSLIKAMQDYNLTARLGVERSIIMMYGALLAEGVERILLNDLASFYLLGEETIPSLQSNVQSHLDVDDALAQRWSDVILSHLFMQVPTDHGLPSAPCNALRCLSGMRI